MTQCLDRLFAIIFICITGFTIYTAGRKIQNAGKIIFVVLIIFHRGTLVFDKFKNALNKFSNKCCWWHEVYFRNNWEENMVENKRRERQIFCDSLP